MARRAAMAWLGGVPPMILLPGRVFAADLAELRFDVHRKGTKIGEHVLLFTRTAGGQHVASHVDLVVKLAFVTAYRYRQDARDEWQGGVLVGTSIETDDNGAVTKVTAEAQGERLYVSGPEGDYALAVGAMTDLNFWNTAIVRQDRLIDSQNGELIAVAVRPDGMERVEVRGQPVEASRYVMSGTKGRSGTIWYDKAGTLVKATVLTRGERLEYALVA